MSDHPAATPAARDTVEVLRAAAQVLRRRTRELPRGPWRWGDPDVGDESATGPTPPYEPRPVLPPHRWPNPLDEPAPLGHRDPFAPFPDDVPPPLRPRTRPRPPTVLDPGVAEPLAALLNLLAEQVERDERGADTETAWTAAALARSVLRSCAPPAVDCPGAPEPH